MNHSIVLKKKLRFFAGILYLIFLLEIFLPPKANAYLFGTLQSDPIHASQNVQNQITLAVQTLSWKQFEPTEGNYNQTYISQIIQRINAFQAAGMQVILEFGIQYPPDWLFAYPNSRYKNQFGTTFTTTESGKNIGNMIFNQQLRTKQANYIAAVFQKFGTNFYAVRVGGGWYGELNYPPQDFNGGTNQYWAFDDIAQGRSVGLPSGMTIAPKVDWIPGTSSTNHTDASDFINWYLNSLKNYHDWQIQTVRNYYSGSIAMLYPSWGIRPGQLDAAIATDLNGTSTAETNGEIQRGFDFARYIQGISDPLVIPYTTWIDTPYGNDTSTNSQDWTPLHFLASIAQPKGLMVWGENTGRGSLADMQRSFQKMADYQAIGLIWAFEPELYSGIYATISDYSQLVAQYDVAVLPSPNVSPSPHICSGDLNLDGIVNLADMRILLLDLWQIPLTNLTSDINHDGLANAFDYATIHQQYITACF